MAEKKIHHWKHGWIPADAYARAIKEGKVKGPTRPGGQRAASSLSGTLPKRVMADKRGEAVDRAIELNQLAPGVGLAHPKYNPGNATMTGHHDGGISLDPAQTEALLNHLDRVAEYPATLRQERQQVGEPKLRGATQSAQAIDRIRALKSAVPGVAEGITPHEAGSRRNPFPTGQHDEYLPAHSGGIDLSPHAADALLTHLRDKNAGTVSNRQSAAAAGMETRRRHPYAVPPKAAALRQSQVNPKANPVGKDFRTMTPVQKIRAAEIMYGTGSPQHLAAQRRFTAAHRSA